MASNADDVAGSPANVDADVAALRPAKLLQPLSKCRELRLSHGIALGGVHQHADAPHAPRLLRARRERPGDRRAAEERDELAPPHSITSSARSRIDIGISTPSALAVLRLIANSKFEVCSTGRSAGCAPRRIFATYEAARCHSGPVLTP
jgi:hypothetical protein